MRIISGCRRGQRLFEFEGYNIRPTTDRVRESIFNLIMDYVSDSEVLDLFGGSGALSFEALSRGALHSTICDTDLNSINLIQKNAESLNFTQNTDIINIRAEQYISETTKKFDIIFMDPPYNKGYIKPIIEAVVTLDILSEEGIIVLESDSTDEHGEFNGLDIIKQRKYGRTYVTVYQRGVTK